MIRVLNSMLEPSQANAFFNRALKIRPILDGTITVDPAITNNYFTLNNTVFRGTDLVIIMTARPSPNKPIAGFATCLQRDQYRRCTVCATWGPRG